MATLKINSMKALENKVAIVTGGAMGMGASAAELFAREGAKVVIADFNEEAAMKQVEKIKNEGGEASFIKTDVSKPEDVQKMVRYAVDTYGGLDVALNGNQSPIREQNAGRLAKTEGQPRRTCAAAKQAYMYGGARAGGRATHAEQG